MSELVFTFEQEHHYKPAGGYGGLIPAWFNYGPLPKYFLGDFEEGSYFAKLGHIYVLGCRDCGEVGCWPLACEVHRENGTIIWDSFQQPHRKEPDYSNFGPFVFLEQQYRDAVEALDHSLSRQSRSDGI